MECPINTVKSRMFQARHKLQSILPRLAAPHDTEVRRPL
jgi:DNA-directed RNA polymerase specialized sigma24 family protein